MISHHIQHKIISALSTNDELGFTDLRPEAIDNKLFTYHLKITIREGYVEKHNDTYRLTKAGQKLWKRIRESPESVALRAFSVLYLIIRSPIHGWLLYRRHTHPMKNKVAFMHAIPDAQESIVQSAHQQTLEKTGLSCNFQVIGAGFFRTIDGSAIDGFTNFTLLECTDPQGKLTPNDPHASYEWVQNPDFSSGEMLPNMPKLASLYAEGKFPFFVDETVELSSR